MADRTVTKSLAISPLTLVLFQQAVATVKLPSLMVMLAYSAIEAIQLNNLRKRVRF